MGHDNADYLHPDDGSAAAFSQLGGEVALLRRAIKRLTAERDVEVPDYVPTLLRTEQHLAGLADEIRAIVNSPALRMTPDMIATKIMNAAHSARLDDQRVINEACVALDHATVGLANRLASARRRGEQRRWLYGTGRAGLPIGALLYAALAGPVVRVMARAWHSPERIAARTVDEAMWASGQGLTASTIAGAWNAVVIDPMMGSEDDVVRDALWARGTRHGADSRRSCRRPAGAIA